MALQLLFASAVTTLLVIISIFVMRRLRTSQTPEAAKKPKQVDLINSFPEPTVLSKTLALVLPNSVILPHDAAAFQQSMKAYWAQQECEVIPACVFRPRDI